MHGGSEFAKRQLQRSCDWPDTKDRRRVLNEDVFFLNLVGYIIMIS